MIPVCVYSEQQIFYHAPMYIKTLWRQLQNIAAFNVPPVSLYTFASEEKQIFRIINFHIIKIIYCLTIVIDGV